MGNDDFPMVDVIRLKPFAGFKVWLQFQPAKKRSTIWPVWLRPVDQWTSCLKPQFFSRVFREMGVPTRPNGFDLDAINL
ncbi:MAG: hypothetical protein U5J99_03150 [Parvularculaceae bacterium]|nr:hypothetical protein [Parvularculaceae bacterium]